MIGTVTVQVTGPAESELADLARAAFPREAGGLLLGWWDGDGVIVRHAIDVPDRRANRNTWTRHPRAAARALEASLLELAHPLLGYVGDWHSHPEVCGASDQDLRALATTSRQYERPVALLVHLPDGTLDVRAAHRGKAHPAILLSPQSMESL
jgi:proteasome lid subunit RPN8/RPN11